jgi:hypothetical protein
MAAPLFFELFFAHQGLAASINVPVTPFAHRAVPQKLCNQLMFISFIYIADESSVTCVFTQAKCQASCPNSQDSIWCTPLFFNVAHQP